MTTVTRKRYTPEFKAQLVELVAIGKPVPEVAEEFGIGTSLLYKWIGKNPQPGQPGGEGHQAAGEEAAAAELPRLRREIAHLKLENDILSLNRSTGFSRFAAIKLFLAGLHLCHELTHPHRRQRLLLAGTEFREPLSRRQCLSGIDLV